MPFWSVSNSSIYTSIHFWPCVLTLMWNNWQRCSSMHISESWNKNQHILESSEEQPSSTFILLTDLEVGCETKTGQVTFLKSMPANARNTFMLTQVIKSWGFTSFLLFNSCCIVHIPRYEPLCVAINASFLKTNQRSSELCKRPTATQQ